MYVKYFITTGVWIDRAEYEDGWGPFTADRRGDLNYYKQTFYKKRR